jgi:hypothetical protein
MIKQTEVTAHLLEILNETGKISVEYFIEEV